MNNFKEQLSKKAGEAEAILAKYLPEEQGLQKTVIEAMNYSVNAGGKRLRPLLMMETYRMFGGTEEVVEPFMAAIEMIHTYSLVHDDLPAMDNDEFRRGRKSTHAQFGEAMGILAGDALLNYAFETAVKAFDIRQTPAVAKAFAVLAGKAGIYGMLGGQVVDVELEGMPIPAETLEFIHENKTAAMIESSMMIGAILAGACEDDVNTVEGIAKDVGFAFQIRDDILDVVSTEVVLGKPIGSDEKNGKTTYVTLYGLERAGKIVEELSDRACNKLKSLNRDNPFLEELIAYLAGREN